MNEKIRKHIDYLFESAPKTRKAMDLKEEMLQNTIEKYQDLVSEGYSAEDAFQNVISSIGDVTELFESLEEKDSFCLSEKDRRKKAMLTAVAVGLYIFAGAVFFTGVLMDESMNYRNGVDLTLLGLIIAAVICIVPTCMLVYAANMYPDYHKKKENSMVEEYKEAVYEKNRDKAIRESLGVIIWMTTFALYFVISFSTGAWHISWVIFLIGVCVQSVAELVLNLRKKQ